MCKKDINESEGVVYQRGHYIHQVWDYMNVFPLQSILYEFFKNVHIVESDSWRGEGCNLQQIPHDSLSGELSGKKKDMWIHFVGFADWVCAGASKVVFVKTLNYGVCYGNSKKSIIKKAQMKCTN